MLIICLSTTPVENLLLCNTITEPDYDLKIIFLSYNSTYINNLQIFPAELTVSAAESS